MLILLVDDSPEVRRALTRLLEGCGHTVCATAHGGEALAVLANLTFDLVLTDHEMPLVSGVQVVTAAQLAKVPVVLMSGDGERARLKLGRAASSVPVLDKPFQLQDLRTAAAVVGVRL